MLVGISSFRTSVVILNKCASHIESLISTEATLIVEFVIFHALEGESTHHCRLRD